MVLSLIKAELLIPGTSGENAALTGLVGLIYGVHAGWR